MTNPEKERAVDFVNDLDSLCRAHNEEQDGAKQAGLILAINDKILNILTAERLKRQEAEKELTKWGSKYTCCESSPDCTNNQTKKFIDEILGEDGDRDKREYLWNVIENLEMDAQMSKIKRGEAETKLSEAMKRVSAHEYAYKLAEERIEFQLKRNKKADSRLQSAEARIEEIKDFAGKFSVGSFDVQHVYNLAKQALASLKGEGK